MDKFSNPDHHHSPFLTNSQPLFLLTEPYWLLLAIFHHAIRLLPSGNYNHAISLDLLSTLPQILVLCCLVLFPQVAPIPSLSHSSSHSHSSHSREACGPLSLPATSLPYKSCRSGLFRSLEQLLLQVSRLCPTAGLQLPGLADIWNDHLSISIAAMLLLASFCSFQKRACSHGKSSELFPKATGSLKREVMLKGAAQTGPMFCSAFEGLGSLNACTHLQMKRVLQHSSTV